MRCFILRLGLLLYTFIFVNSVQAGEIRLAVDYAEYKLSGQDSYFEVYYAIRQSDLKFEPSDSAFTAQAMVRLRISRNDSAWVDDLWKVPLVIDDTTRLNNSANFVDVLSYQAQPGEYKLALIVEDLSAPGKSDSTRINFPIGKWKTGDGVRLSDMEVSTSIKRAAKDANNVFCKNTLEVLPNPGATFGAGLPTLYYYIEAYNLQSGLTSDQYSTLCHLSNVNGDTVYSHLSRKRNKKRRGDTSIEIGRVQVGDLPSGVFLCNFSILDPLGKVLDSISRKFFIYNPSQVAAVGSGALQDDGSLGVFAEIDEAALDLEFKYIQYILRKEGKEFYNSLSGVDAKRKFLKTFWDKNNTNPVSKVNDFRLSYLQRVEDANERFKGLGREGWRTDRGRVFILYGEPSEIDWNRSTTASKPFEIWNYFNLESGVEFVFVDITGFNSFRLVHSTLTGGVRNENWRDFIKEHAN